MKPVDVSPRAFAAIGLILLAIPALCRAQSGDHAQARRIADVTAIALDEYGEGVVAGHVVSEDELREARLFLDEARRAAAELPEAARGEATALIDSLVSGVQALRGNDGLLTFLAELRAALERSLGVTLDPLPSEPPLLGRGERLYTQYCRQCHGPGGAGDGPLGATLDPPAADLTDRAALSGSSPADFFRKLNVGVAGTAMPAFGEQLGLDDRWSVALYASLLRFDGGTASGARQLEGDCAECALVLSDFTRTAFLSDDSLAAVIGELVGGERGAGDGVDPDVMAFARAAGAAEHWGSDNTLAAARAVYRAKLDVAAAVEIAASGERDQAAARVLDAYLVFEQVESGVRARNPNVAGRVEQTFTQLRGSLLADGAWVRVTEARRDVDDALDAAMGVVTARPSPFLLFGQSIVILVREGLEALLIVGALMAFVGRSGATKRRRDIGWGVAAAGGASLLTALGFATLFRNAWQHREALEGFTMLVAAAVLFWVSYWLVSKVELQKWQAFVSAQLKKALRSRSAYALAAVAFLAVYREGFETVLFYAALFTSADRAWTSTGAVLGGMGVGAAALAVVYLILQRYSVRIALKPFFAITSAFLYVMAFSFAGQGVAELQGAGIMSVTPLSWMPAVPFLGIFPTTQTLVSQLLLATALVVALAWIFWLQPVLQREHS